MNRLILVLIGGLVFTAVGASAGPQDMTVLEQMNKTKPLIVGTVESTTDHSVTVTTKDGELMSFEIDSRSVVPVDAVLTCTT